MQRLPHLFSPRSWALQASLAPAVMLSVAVHAAALSMVPGFGVRQPDIEPIVLAVRVIEPVAVPVAEPARRPEHIHPPVEPGHAPPLAKRPLREQVLQKRAPAMPRPVHADNLAVGSAPAIETPPAAAPDTAAAEEAPLAAETPREVNAAPPIADSGSNADISNIANSANNFNTAPLAALGHPRVKPPHHNVAYLDNPPPAYPPAARRMRLEGLAIVRALVSAEGKVESMKIEKTSGSDLLDDAAQRAVKGWRFVPARIGTEAVAHWVDIPIQFRLSD